MRKSVLSIDFSYFQRATIEAFKSYPENPESLSELSALIWAGQYLDVEHGPLTRSVGILGEELMRLKRILQAQPEDCPVMITDRHVHIYDFIHAQIPAGADFNLYHIDLHHDMANGITGMTSENWLRYILKEYRVYLHWVINPASMALHGFDQNERMLESLARVVMPDLVELEQDYIGDRTFDAVFLCRSDLQTVPHLDPFFTQLCHDMERHFTKVDMQERVRRGRNYWRYIGETEADQKYFRNASSGSPLCRNKMS